MNKQELAKFKEILLKEKASLLEKVNMREKDSLGRSMKNSAGEISSYRIHMADLASDNLEEDTSLDLLSTEEATLIKIEKALRRIEKGTYGKCLRCGKSIGMKRLNALPYAELCRECQEREEKG